MNRHSRKRNDQRNTKSLFENNPKQTIKTKVKITGRTNREAIKESMQKAKEGIAQEILG